MSRSSRVAAAVLLLLILAAPSSLSAQAASGSLYGLVTDERGCPLPAARVTVRGEQGAPRVQMTNRRGEFRFLGLEPALYHAQVELAGFSTAEYPDIPVHLGRSTSIEVLLAASDSGAVTVTAECPLLDERRISTGVNVTQEELEKIPTGRDPWSILQQAPGVLLDRIDVGGNEGGLPAVARGPGSGIDQNTYAIDGVPITDPAAISTTPTVWDFASFDEMQATTGGTDAAVSTGGVALNMVTKRGTDVWRASARFMIVDENWQGEAEGVDRAAGQESFTPSPRLDRVREYGAEGGGPVLEDWAWIWLGHHRTTTNVTLEPSPWLFDQGPGDRRAKNSALKIDAALGSSNRLQGFAYANDAEIATIGAGPSTSLESTFDLDAPTDVYKLEDAYVLGPNLYLHGHLSRVDAHVDSTSHGGDLSSRSDRQRDQAKIEVSGFFGTDGESHEMKLGAAARDADVTTVASFQPVVPTVELGVTSAYVQDTFAARDLIGDVGLRYDEQEAERGPAAVQWESLVPRIGLTYAIGEERATLVRATWSRFADQLGIDLPLEEALGGTVIDPSLEAPATDEVLFGAEHAGVGCFSIGGRLTWRRSSDLLEHRQFVRDASGQVRIATRDDYVPDTFATGTVPDHGAYSVPVYALRPGLESTATELLVNGRREVEYLGATVWLERRLRNRWQFRGYANLRDETQGVPPEVFELDDPTDLLGFEDNDGAPFAPRSVFADKSGVFLHSRWDYSIAGLYRARGNVAIALLAHGREGYPLLYFENVLGGDGRTRSVAVTDEDSPLRLDDVHLFDARVEKQLAIGDTGVIVSFDVFNLLNQTVPLQRGLRLESPGADFVREIVSPRTLRLGARLEFR